MCVRMCVCCVLSSCLHAQVCIQHNHLRSAVVEMKADVFERQPNLCLVFRHAFEASIADLGEPHQFLHALAMQWIVDGDR